MEFTNLLHEIKLPAEVILALEERRHLFEEHRELILAITDSATSEASNKTLETLLGDDDMGILACQLYAATHTRELYRAKGIDDRIFLDTLGCFRRFLGETAIRTGRVYFDRWWWTFRQLSMRIFRIGQLEFEMMREPFAIAMHIPSDSKITSENVDASIAAAREFFAKYYPEYAQAPFGCESWLLSPTLRGLLGPDSRIGAFSDRFMLIHVDPDPKDVWEWLFRASEDTPVEELPETTSLQKNVKYYLLEGGSIGVARGILK